MVIECWSNIGRSEKWSAGVIKAIDKATTKVGVDEVMAKAKENLDRIKTSHPEIAAMRARGREIEADRLVREGLEIVDAEIEDSDTASAEVSRARNRFEARKWLAGCWSRDTYGERPPVVAVQVTAQFVAPFGGMAGRVAGE